MKKILAILLFVLAGCAVQKPQVIIRDSVRIEYRDRIVRDTAKIEVPVEVEKIVTKDTVSHLENTYAKSDAMVSEGLLYHSLESKPQIIKVPFEVHVTDTLVVEKDSQVIEKEIKVEKELNWWQKFRLNAFWWLLGGLVVALLWIFRKPLMSLLKTAI